MDGRYRNDRLSGYTRALLAPHPLETAVGPVEMSVRQVIPIRPIPHRPIPTRDGILFGLEHGPAYIGSS